MIRIYNWGHRGDNVILIVDNWEDGRVLDNREILRELLVGLKPFSDEKWLFIKGYILRIRS